MHVNTWPALILGTTLLTGAAFTTPAAAQPSPTATTAPVTLTLTRAAGHEAVVATGNAPAARPVELAAYATYSRDLPTVLLSRRVVTTDANGRFTTTLPLAPAYFRGALVTVVVRSVPDGPSATARISVTAPNDPTPADADPSDH
ncbi:MAG: hypothetical protein JO103_02575 [Candidatus Eremiobacteraeota bacterium]|nr:hypothetical protein [Candidatus Eremiobacteraeota bacterium]MBV9408312.1 hypothetical protein [Candidatus Eremiobacteraeota bacterium]